MSKKKPPKLPVPTESEEQQLIFEWATIARLGYPELEMLFHDIKVIENMEEENLF